MAWMIPAAIAGSSLLSYQGGERRNTAQVASAREQMEFQREMSNTSHQRQVKDLRAAGLNPILSARYGGSSTPGGAQATIQDTITPAVNTGLQSLQQTTTAKKTVKETERVTHEISQAFFDAFRTGETNPNKILQERHIEMIKKLDAEQQLVVLNTLKETLKQAKKKGLINDLKYRALLEAVKHIGDSFPKLKELFGQF